MDKNSCSAQCAKSVAYFLLGVVVGGLIFYITTLVAAEFVQTNIFRFKSPTLKTTTSTTQFSTTIPKTSTLQPVSEIDLVGERGSEGN
jgi:hypothetical protein